MLPDSVTLPYTAEYICARRLEQVQGHAESDETERPADAPCIDAAVAASYNGALYLSEVGNGHTDPIQLAGLLLYHLAKKHCFTDGNKRIAWIIAVDYLARHNLRIIATQEEAANFVIDVAENRIDRDGAIDWLGADRRLGALLV